MGTAAPRFPQRAAAPIRRVQRGESLAQMLPHECSPTLHKTVPSVPQGNAVSMEILLPSTVDFEVDMHLPVFEEARLEGEERGLL